MTLIYYNSKKEPHTLSIKWDKIASSPELLWEDAHFLLTPERISIYGILGVNEDIEDYDNKGFNPKGSKALCHVHKTTSDVYNRDTKKYEAKPVHRNEAYLFLLLEQKLLTLDPDEPVRLMFMPTVQDMLWGLIESKDPDMQPAITKGLDRLVQVSPSAANVLTPADKVILTDTVTAKSGFGGGKAYTPAETEAVKLEARWNFIQRQIEPIATCGTLAEAVITAESMASDGQKTLTTTLTLLAQICGN